MSKPQTAATLRKQARTLEAHAKNVGSKGGSAKALKDAAALRKRASDWDTANRKSRSDAKLVGVDANVGGTKPEPKAVIAAKDSAAKAGSTAKQRGRAAGKSVAKSADAAAASAGSAVSDAASNVTSAAATLSPLSFAQLAWMVGGLSVAAIVIYNLLANPSAFVAGTNGASSLLAKLIYPWNTTSAASNAKESASGSAVIVPASSTTATPAMRAPTPLAPNAVLTTTPNIANYA